MKNEEVDALTECADDLSLYHSDKPKIHCTKSILRYMPNIFKKTNVDFLYLAIAEILRNEKMMQLTNPTERNQKELLKNILYIISQQQMFDVHVIDDNLYCDGKLVSTKEISYGVHMNDKLFEAMITLQNPVCLWIQFGQYGFCIIRELHSPSIILRERKRYPIASFFSPKVNIDVAFIDDLICNADISHKRKRLC